VRAVVALVSRVGLSFQRRLLNARKCEYNSAARMLARRRRHSLRYSFPPNEPSVPILLSLQLR
jgi:hypothetical protein